MSEAFCDFPVEISWVCNSVSFSSYLETYINFLLKCEVKIKFPLISLFFIEPNVYSFTFKGSLLKLKSKDFLKTTLNWTLRCQYKHLNKTKLMTSLIPCSSVEAIWNSTEMVNKWKLDKYTYWCRKRDFHFSWKLLLFLNLMNSQGN